MRSIVVAAFVLVLATTGASAQCFKDLGRKKAGTFGAGQQLKALQKRLTNSKCKTYGVRWSLARKNGNIDKGMIVFNSKTGELIKAVYVSKNNKRRLQAESWAGVSKTALRNDSAANGFDQKHNVKIKSGTSMVVSASSARFMRQNRLSSFLRGSNVTAGRSEPAEEEETAVAEADTAVEATETAQSTETAQTAEASGDVETVAALSETTAPSQDEISGSKHKACLQEILNVEATPLAEAKASISACEEELQIVEGQRQQGIRNAKQARFTELLTMHLTGRLSDCLTKLAKLGKAPGAEVKESSEKCEGALKSRLGKASDEQLYAMLETERDHAERLALIWKIPNAAARERQLEREERRHQRELSYLESCVKEIIDLGAKPSDGAMADWNACRSEKFAARSEARKRTDAIERQIIGTRDPRERRRLALEIPLKEMKQYWLNHIEREEKLSSTSATTTPRR